MTVTYHCLLSFSWWGEDNGSGSMCPIKPVEQFGEGYGFLVRIIFRYLSRSTIIKNLTNKGDILHKLFS